MFIEDRATKQFQASARRHRPRGKGAGRRRHCQQSTSPPQIGSSNLPPRQADVLLQQPRSKLRPIARSWCEPRAPTSGGHPHNPPSPTRLRQFRRCDGGRELQDGPSRQGVLRVRDYGTHLFDSSDVSPCWNPATISLQSREPGFIMTHNADLF